MKNKSNKRKSIKKEPDQRNFKEKPLRWFVSDFANFATLHNHPRKDLLEDDPPDCSCLSVLAYSLLKIGGHSVANYRRDDALRNYSYVSRGQTMTGENVRMKSCDPNDCHQNVGRLWLKNPNNYRIVSGFAVHKSDEMWIAHSWLLEKDERIVETTFRFDIYHGHIMSQEQAEEFAVQHPNKNLGEQQ